MARRSLLLSAGSYLPKEILTNAELARRVETSDDWISQRTGIRQRHIAAPGELTSDLAVHAAEQALHHAGLRGADIDMLVVATTTPDHTFPATATKVQQRLGMKGGFAMDVQAVCSGFVYALATADNFIRVGQAHRALVIGAETFSRILDWKDRNTCVLFGDGAGAVVLEAGEGNGTSKDRGILCTHLFSDGSYYDKLYVDGGPSATQTTGVVHMEGKEVFRHAVVNLAAAVDAAIASAGITPDDVDWLVPHQANRRIIDSMGSKLKLPPEKVVVTIDRHANTSAASIPLALAEAVNDGRIQRGQLVLMEAMGGGFTWGSALIRY
ncbi:beta-ketoacyl-ACP synthase III [Dongia rigui]|uniref:Beta-ketoacyl-[acyl-carrier-protein] synthase III n=1 Tax=Dongia rigui TaxID=940149 RepID=A0ABU5E0I4_9PROT|nr:beta-ketoacyl-ACP synthase III [Dongia rigui]MDY0873096.1 beta-ketoacyl-ACP synthase III [Dongia rigui]